MVVAATVVWTVACSGGSDNASTSGGAPFETIDDLRGVVEDHTELVVAVQQAFGRTVQRS